MRSSLLAIAWIIAFPVYSGIVINGTRFIYSEHNAEISLSVENPEEKNSYLIQSWIEDEHKQKTKDFIVIPPILKLVEKSHNKLKVIKIKNDFPSDRETLLWLNIKSIPYYKKDDSNNLNIVIKSSFKIIYRPELLDDMADFAHEKLLFKLDHGVLTATNPTGHYITFRDLHINNKEIDTPGMLSPFGQKEWLIDNVTQAEIVWSTFSDHSGKTEPISKIIVKNIK